MKWKRIADCAVSECRRFMIAPDARGRFVARIYADAESTKHEAESTFDLQKDQTPGSGRSDPATPPAGGQTSPLRG